MDRLSTLDAEFLHLEDGVAHMHIAGACVFDDPAPSLAELRALVASKLHLLTRYRQRVRTVPLQLGRPLWVDDPHFELDYHLRHTALPAPGDDATFTRLVGRLMSQPLDRARPLWETWLVEGLEGDRWALVCKVHHCMVDGVAGVELLTVLLDPTPTVVPEAPRPWEPSPEPPGVVKVLDAWAGLAHDAVRELRGVPEALTHPGETLRTGIETVEGAARFLGRLRATPELSIEGSIGPHRVWTHTSVGLGEVKAIRSVFGGTINDVVLCAVSGGLRALLHSRGEDPDAAVVRSLVPVSTRQLDAHGVPDNRVTALLYDLPVQIADPVERLDVVCEQMTELKASHMDSAGATVVGLGDLAPPLVVGQLSAIGMRAVRQLSQRAINTVTTNVPGPQFPLFCLGREMRDYYPYVPISHGVRVSTAIISYNGRLFFGITGDYGTAPDVEVVSAAITTEIAEMCERARSSPTEPSTL